MTKYEIMYEALQEKVNSGELTVEDAEILNDIAYDRYAEDMTEYTESCDEGMTYEEYLESMEDDLFGESTRLGREIHKKAEEFSNNREEYYRLMMKAKEDMKKSQETGNKKRADIMKKYYDKYSKLYNDGYKSQEMDTLDKALKKKYIRGSEALKYKQREEYNLEPAKEKEPGQYDFTIKKKIIKK